MRLIDSHSHLFLDEFEHDLAQVVDNCKGAGVEMAFLPNIDSTTITSLQRTVALDPDFFQPMMGLHPTSVKTNFKNELEIIEMELRSNKYRAVGETGIDLYWDKTYLQEQVESFEFQIELAKELNLPIVIHARASFKEIFEVIDRLNDDRLTGIFHCFTGTVEEAVKIQQYGGFKMGIGGVVTFKNGGLDKVLAKIPLSEIVLETDSPYLAPVPFRGKRNESAYIVYVANKVAEIYNRPVEEIAEITTENSRTIFKL